MPGKGGKNKKKGKSNSDHEKRELVFKEEGQDYASVEKMLGNGWVAVVSQGGEKRQAHIRGAFRKKVWINVGDVVLLGLRDFQDSKADIILKYTPDEARLLKSYGELTENTKINENDGEGSDDGGKINLTKKWKWSSILMRFKAINFEQQDKLSRVSLLSSQPTLYRVLYIQCSLYRRSILDLRVRRGSSLLKDEQIHESRNSSRHTFLRPNLSRCKLGLQISLPLQDVQYLHFSVGFLSCLADESWRNVAPAQRGHWISFLVSIWAAPSLFAMFFIISTTFASIGNPNIPII